MGKCKNCDSILYGKYCSNCGQKVYTEKDKSISNLLHEIFHFLTHFEGKFFKTIKTIFQNPGKLSIEYNSGIRQKYYKPISLYILIIVLYLFYPLVSGMNMDMKYYKKTALIGQYLSHQIDKKIETKKITEEQLSEKFHEKSKNVSKFLMLILIPLAACILYLLYFNKRLPLFDNFILSTEINIFFLLVFFILFPVLIIPFLYVFKIPVFNENYYIAIMLILFFIYVTNILHKVFEEKWGISVLKAGLFVSTYLIVINLVYKTLVFEITLALI